MGKKKTSNPRCQSSAIAKSNHGWRRSRRPSLKVTSWEKAWTSFIVEEWSSLVRNWSSWKIKVATGTMTVGIIRAIKGKRVLKAERNWENHHKRMRTQGKTRGNSMIIALRAVKAKRKVSKICRVRNSLRIETETIESPLSSPSSKLSKWKMILFS